MVYCSKCGKQNVGIGKHKCKKEDIIKRFSDDYNKRSSEKTRKAKQ